MEQAIVTCTRAAADGTSCISTLNGLPLNNISASNFNSNLITLRAHLFLAICYLCWWSFLPPTSALTLVAHVVLTLCYLTGGLKIK